MSETAKNDNKTAVKEDLGGDAIRGTFWTGAGQILRQIIQLTTAITLARLLGPEEFGLLGMAMVFVGFSQLFADFGIGAAIVQKPQVTPQELATSHWLNLLIGAMVAVLLIVIAEPVANFYGEPRLVVVIQVLSVTLLLAGALVIPRAILFRTMDFRSAAMSQVMGTLIGSTSAITIAWVYAGSSAGLWALVLQPVIGTSTELLVAWVRSRWWPMWYFKPGEIGGLIRFSGAVLGSNLINHAGRNGDDLIIGKILGSQALGLYSYAYQIMLYPLQQVSGVIVKVLFPTLSKIQNNQKRFEKAYFLAVGAVAFITFPLMMGLWSVSEELVPVVFGEQWLELIPLINVMAFAGLVQSVNTVVGVIYLSRGRPGVLFKFTAITTPVLLVLFLVSTLYWGLYGVAVAYTVASVLMSFPVNMVAFRVAEFRMRTLFFVTVRPFTAALLMAGVVVFGKTLWGSMEGLPMALSLLMSIVLGGLSYVLFSLLINRQQSLELIARIRSAAS